MPILVAIGALLMRIAPSLFLISRVMLAGFVIRLVTGLGFGLVSYKYVGGFFDKMNAEFVAGYNSLPSAVLALLDIGGFTTGINIILSAMSMIVGMWMAKSTLSILT